MRKLNGITIDGEFLGNSVVINGMFRAICTISPIVMRDFVYIINRISQLDESVKINTFNCPDTSSIDIEFSNSKSEGYVTLIYTLQDSEPSLIDCNIVIDDEEIVDSLIDEFKNNEQYLPEVSQAEHSVNSKTDIESANPAYSVPAEENSIAESDISSEGVSKGQLSDINQKFSEQPVFAQNSVSEKHMSERPIDEAETISLNEPGRDNAAVSVPEEFGKPPGNIAEENIDTNISQNSISNQTNMQNILADKSYDTVNSIDDNIQDMEEPENMPAINKTEGKAKSGYSVIQERRERMRNKKRERELLEAQERQRLEEEAAAREYAALERDNYQDNPITAEQNRNQDALSLAEEHNQAQQNTDTADDNTSKSESGMQTSSFMSDAINSNSDSNSFGSDDKLENDDSVKVKTSDVKENNDYTIFAKTLKIEIQNVEGWDALAAAASGGGGQYASGNGFGGNNFNMQNGYGSNNDYGNPQEFNGQNYQGYGNAGGPGGGYGGGLGGGYGGQPQQGFNQNFMPPNNGFNGNNGFNYPPQQNYNQWQNQPFEYNSGMPSQPADAYSYDNNYGNSEDLSDLYSDFYSNFSASAQGDSGSKQPTGMSELDALQAEIDAIKSGYVPPESLMTLDQFRMKQRQLEEEKLKATRRKMRIVGSKERVNASALDGGVFVEGKKVYKWGDTKKLVE